MIKKAWGKIGLLILLILLVQTALVTAQGPDDQTSTDAETSDSAETAEEADATALEILPAGQLNLSFEQLGYDSRNLRNHDAQHWFYFNLPGNFEILPTENYLDLVTTHYPASPDQPSTLEIELAGSLIGTVPLQDTNPISPTSRIGIPADLLTTGQNILHLRLDTGGSCENLGALLDVLVDSSSSISFNYRQNPYPTDLALYPYPFTEVSLLDIPTTIVIPDQPSANILSAVATIAAGLGQASNGTMNIRIVTTSDFDSSLEANSHLLVLGTPDSQPLLQELDLSRPVDEALLDPEQGLLEEIVSPWNPFRLALVVSGLDDEGILKASQALNRRAHFLGMKGSAAIVLELAPVGSDETRQASTLTFEALGYDDEIAYGTRADIFNYNFALPLGWQMEEPAFFLLKFSHADILSPTASVVDVELNGIPLSSTLLNEENKLNGETIVSLPQHRLRLGQNRLRVMVQNMLSDGDECGNLANQRAWTVISNQSEIFLPYTVRDVAADLSLFPYPFSQSTGIDDTLFVLPEELTQAALNQLAMVAVRLGSASLTEKLSLSVQYSSAVDEAVLKDFHIILLGRPTQNVLFEQINQTLPHPFVSNSDTLEPLAVDTVVFSPDPTRDAGILELTTSPWNEAKSLLTLTGTTEQGIDYAVEGVLSSDRRLAGNLAIVELVPAVGDQEAQLDIYAVETRAQASAGDDNLALRVGSDIIPGTKDLVSAQSDQFELSQRWWR